jgi:hypothetical protein
MLDSSVTSQITVCFLGKLIVDAAMGMILHLALFVGFTVAPAPNAG